MCYTAAVHDGRIIKYEWDHSHINPFLTHILIFERLTAFIESVTTHSHKKEDYINKIVLKQMTFSHSVCVRVCVCDFLCVVNIVVMKDQKKTLYRD